MPEPIDRSESWPVHDSEVIWDGGGPFSVRRDELSAPGHPGEKFARLVLDHPGAAVVLAVDDDDMALVVEQYRHPTRRRFVELPAGLLDVPGEDPLEAARRELAEEGRLRAAEWTHLLTAYPSPGLSSERMEIYLARGLSETDHPEDFELAHEEADMQVSWVPVDDLVAGLLAGRLTDGPLAMAVLTYRMRARGSGPLA